LLKYRRQLSAKQTADLAILTDATALIALLIQISFLPKERRCMRSAFAFASPPCQPFIFRSPLSKFITGGSEAQSLIA